MSKSFIVKKYLFLFFGISIFLLASCNNNGADKKTSSDSAAISSNAASANSAAAVIISGTLDTLYVDSLTFTKLPNGKKVVFSFTFDQSSNLKMDGWILKNPNPPHGTDPFDNDPDIKLKNGKAGSYNYGPGTYFGNEILQNTDVKKIKDFLNSEKAQYVLFVPEIKPGKNNIYYKVFVSKDDPSAFIKTMIAAPTGVDLNPSPPKGTQ